MLRILIAVSSVWALAPNTEVCLPNGIPHEFRHNLTYDGYNGPVMDVNMAWDSAKFVAKVYEILSTEILGYNYDYYGDEEIWGSQTVSLGLSGCHEVRELKECGDGDHDEWHPLFHVGPEAWHPAVQAEGLIPKERRATKLTSHGYTGVETIFVMKSTAQKAAWDDTLILSTYEGWNVTAFPKIYDHLDSIQSMKAKLGVTDKLTKFNFYTASSPVGEYKTVTGDNGNGCYDSVTDTLSAENIEDEDGCSGDFWTSPACRADPGACIPVITFSAYAKYYIAQWQALYDMPTAVLDTTWGGWYDTVPKANIPFYWWIPDSTFAKYGEQMVALPQHNPAQYAKGDYSTAIQDSELTKWVWHHLENANNGHGANLVAVLNRLTVFDAEIAEVMKGRGNSLEFFDLACAFLKNPDYEERWNSWIPDLTQCGHGEGWVDGEGCSGCEGGTVSTFDEKFEYTTLHNVLQKGNRACEVCPEGHFCPARTSSALLCPAGQMCESGVSAGELCGLGMQQPEQGKSFCEVCADGHYSDTPGTVLCFACLPGHFSVQGELGLEGASSCTNCDQGWYAEGEANKECTKCPGLMTTRLLAAVSQDECVCSANFFYANAAKEAWRDPCLPCQDNMVCPGGNELALVEAGFFAETVPKDLTNGAKLERFKVWKCPGGDDICTGGDVATETAMTPLQFNVRKVTDKCPGVLFKNGCSRCPDGFYMTDLKCQSCGGGDGALFPIIYLLGIGCMVLLYKITTYQPTQKLTNMLMLSCSASLLLNFFQLMGVIALSYDFPDFLGFFFEFFQLFVFDIDVLKASCATGSSFYNRFLTRTLTPIVFLLTFAALYPVSIILSKLTPKVGACDYRNMLNTVGLLCNAGYIAFCKISFQYYECKSHPSAPSTVAVYPDIDCGSEEHSSMMGTAVFMSLLYGGGIYLTSVYLCWVAPQKTSSLDWRRKTRFLVGRWNPNRWYWGPVLQTRNLLIAFVAVIAPSDVSMQFAMTGSLLTIYSGLQGTFKPWRDTFLNTTDSVLSGVIILTCIFAMLLVVDLGLRESRTGNVEVVLGAVLVIGFMTLLAAVGIAVDSLMRPMRSRQKAAKRTLEAAKILLLQTKCIYQLILGGISETEFAAAISNYMTAYEQSALFNTARVVTHELCGVKCTSGISLETRLMINAVETEVDVKAADMAEELQDETFVGKNHAKGRVSAMSKLG